MNTNTQPQMQTQPVSPWVFIGLTKLNTPGPAKLQNLTVTDVIKQVCHRQGVPPDQITSPVRTRLLSQTRYIIYYFCLKYITGANTNNMGELIGTSHDHSTIIHGRDTIAREIELYEHIALHVESIRQDLIALDQCKHGEVVKSIAN